MSPGMLRRDISCRFIIIIIIIIINQRGGGVAQRHTITALGNPPHHLKFINGLRRYQKLKDAEIEGLIAGRNAAQRRLAYECVNRRIKNVVLDYQNHDIIDYLRGLAHNIMH